MAGRQGLLMDRIREHYGKNGKSWMPDLAVKTRLGPFFCLATLLALTFLPLVHQGHLNGLKKSHAFHAAENGHKIGLRLSEPDSDKPQPPYHNAATCPICQAGSMCQYFSAPARSSLLILALLVQWCWESSLTFLVANFDILPSGPRAPPASL